MKIYNIKASFGFSLIELSIVLIIIALLIAGVVGGSSLIESAKTRLFMNEMLEHKQNLYTFKVAKGRLPGDLNNSGKIGANSGHNYSSGDFPSPYDGSSENSEYGVPNAKTAPYVELYLEGISNFQPKKVNLFYNFEAVKAGAIPKSKAFNHYSFNIEYVNTSSSEEGDCMYNRKHGNWLYTDSYIEEIEKRISPKIPQQIDLKLDDGLDNSGNFRAYCGEINGTKCFSSEENRYDKAETCNWIMYFLTE